MFPVELNFSSKIYLASVINFPFRRNLPPMDNSHFKNTEISSKTQVSCPWTSAAPLFTPWLSKTQSQLNKNGGNVRENIAASTSGTSEREVVADKKVITTAEKFQIHGI